MPEAIPGKPTPAASESTTSDVVEPLWKKVLNDRFTLLEPVGVGGMGKVYKAIQAPLDRVVAVKILTPNGGADPGFRQRFFLEASLTSKLRHPNTVTVIDYGETADGIFFLAMEFLDGQPLSQVLAHSGPLHWTRCIRIGQQICRSLREAHKLGIVHRDLKPGNVMLLTEDRDQDLVKVLDFGLVKSFIRENTNTENQSEITNPGMLLGSPRYMAPEQLRNQADPRSDIYSLGAVLYEMLVGHPPFSAKDAIDVMFMHMNEPPKPLRAARPNIEVPKELEAVVMKCLEKQPAWRFQSMDDVLEAMRKAAHAAGASGIAGEIPSDPTPPPRSNREILTLTEPVPDGTFAIDIDVVSPRERAMAWLQPHLAKLKSPKVWSIAAAALVIVLVAYLGQRRYASAARSEAPAAEAAKEAAPVPLEEPVQKGPPATAGAVAKTVVFKIASVPPGARVLVNGRAAGHTPVSVAVPAGADGKAYAELSFSLRGYQSLTVSTGGFGPEMALSQVLQPLPAAPSRPEPRRRESAREAREARLVKEVAEAAPPERVPESEAPSRKAQFEEAPQMLAMAEASKPKPAGEAILLPPPSPPAANAVLRFRDGMSPPEQLEGKPIVYSAAAIEAGVQGTIEAKCVITIRGTLENCRIVKSLPYMDKAVLDALATRKYTPVTLEGKPVPVEYVFAIKLVLKEKERKCVGSRCDE